MNDQLQQSQGTLQYSNLTPIYQYTKKTLQLYMGKVAKGDREAHTTTHDQSQQSQSTLSYSNRTAIGTLRPRNLT